MSEINMRERVAELQAEGIPPATWGDILTEGDDGERRITDEEKTVFDEYFRHFMVPPRDEEQNDLCPSCRLPVRGGVEGFITGAFGDTVALEWGLAHGEAFCSGCSWPYRLYHYNVGPLKRLVVGLPYHPSEIQFKAEGEE